MKRIDSTTQPDANSPEPAAIPTELDPQKLRSLTEPEKRQHLMEETFRALGRVDSRDSLLGANQIQSCFWGGSVGCDGPFGFERRGVGADGTADHRPT